jgi:hypothetical protein
MCDDLDRKTEQARRDGRRVSSPPPRPAHPGRLPAKRAG